MQGAIVMSPLILIFFSLEILVIRLIALSGWMPVLFSSFPELISMRAGMVFPMS